MTAAPRQPCALRALGMVTALGRGPEETWPRLVAARRDHFRQRDDLVPDKALWVAEVPGVLPEIPPRLRSYACRANAMTLAALTQIEKPIAAAIDAYGRGRIGVVMGSSTSGVSDCEAAIRQQHATGTLSESFHYDQLEFGGISAFVSELLEVDGPAYTISTACSSGARALATARSLLALGVCDAVVAGATDTLCGLTTNGFSSLHAISPEVTNPCSANRNGLTLGEGSAIFLVTRESSGVQLLGVGESSEAHHMSAPDPEGGGAEQAMRGALHDAGLTGPEIAYLNLHGTGTPLNDVMECAAIARTFDTSPLCSSTKSLVGHTLGAAGAIEAAFCWMMLREAEDGELALIPHAFDGDLDPVLAPPRLVAPGERAPLGPVMSNSFGFGGNNCTLILGLGSQAR
jgi:3-oxoacyl-[acyl-carrier-protein] synthase-1